MTPRSLDALRRDDELLDRLGARAIDPREAGDDLAVRLLAALAEDVDHDLPAGVDSVDSVAVEALAAAVSLRSRAAQGVAGTPTVSVVRELPRRRRVVAVRRGGAVVAGLALVLTSAGVAAAVTGDPAGAFGVRAVSSIIDHVSHRHAAATAATELKRRVQATERLAVVDPTVVATLEAQARELPDQGGPEVQAALARLRQRLQSATGGSGAGTEPRSAASHGAGQPSGHGSASAPGHERSADPEHTSPGHTPARGSHGKASGRATTDGSGAKKSSVAGNAHGKGSPHGGSTVGSSSTAPLAGPTSAGSGGDAGQGTGHGNGGGGNGGGGSQGNGGDHGGQGSGRGRTAVHPG